MSYFSEASSELSPACNFLANACEEPGDLVSLRPPSHDVGGEQCSTLVDGRTHSDETSVVTTGTQLGAGNWLQPRSGRSRRCWCAPARALVLWQQRLVRTLLYANSQAADSNGHTTGRSNIMQIQCRSTTVHCYSRRAKPIPMHPEGIFAS